MLYMNPLFSHFAYLQISRSSQEDDDIVEEDDDDDEEESKSGDSKSAGSTNPAVRPTAECDTDKPQQKSTSDRSVNSAGITLHYKFFNVV